MLDVVEGCCEGGAVGHVEAHGAGLPADQLGGRGGGLAIDVADHHADVGRGQRAGGGRSDAAGGAGDERDPPGQRWVRLVTLTFPGVILKSRLQR